MKNVQVNVSDNNKSMFIIYWT